MHEWSVRVDGKRVFGGFMLGVALASIPRDSTQFKKSGFYINSFVVVVYFLNQIPQKQM